MKELKYLNKYLFKYKYHLIFGTLFLIISNVFGIIPAALVRYAFNLVKENIDLYPFYQGFSLQEDTYEIFATSILIFGVLIIAMALLRGIFLFFVRQTIIVMSRLIEYDLKNEIFAHYQSLPLSFYRKNNTGDLMARISEDVNHVRMYRGPAIMYGINMLTLFMMVIPFMFTVSVKLSLYVLIPLPLLSISIYFVNNIINRRSAEIQQSLSTLSTYVQEAFSGIRVLKAFVRERDSVRHFFDKSVEYKDKSISLAFVNALFFPLILSLIGLSVILTVYIGGMEVINGSLTVGNIAEFVIYVNMLTWPVTSLGWITSITQRAAASQGRINEFLSIQSDIISTENIEKEINGKIEFIDVSFTYEDSGVKALKNISFDIEAGESIAIIGTTGSGKSTIANLICRLYDTKQGEIRIDGLDIKAYGLNCLRGQIGYVPQDVFLFSDTIHYNITFGNADMTAEEAENAAKEADVYNNIKAFSKGFQTHIGERGITLSIARAIARRPKILILDDCLSAVDTKTENSILNSMMKIMEGRTSVIISHRISSAKLADKVIVLDDGEIVEEGTNRELLQKEGVYKYLYEKQLQTEEIL